MALTDLPIGSIVSWKNIAIPSGWAVCDGQNGTPDLRDRIPRGASVDGDLRGLAVHQRTFTAIQTQPFDQRTITGVQKGLL
jgi:hypothetical protein